MCDVPFGAAKCITLPSSLNMFTSSIAWIGWVFSFFSAVCSFLSSPTDDLCTFLVFLLGVPLPLVGWSATSHSSDGEVQTDVPCASYVSYGPFRPAFEMIVSLPILTDCCIRLSFSVSMAATVGGVGGG